MNDLDHQRAERLVLEASVEAQALSPSDQSWLERHLEGCERCAALARSTTGAIEQLRGVSVAVDPELVARTRLLVKFRTRELERGHSWLLPVWILCGLSWVIGIVTAPLVWRGFEWMGHRAGLPTLVWAGGFVLWWAVPALAVLLLLGAGRRQAASRT
jgi:anti-sigma factor RsiW